MKIVLAILLILSFTKSVYSQAPGLKTDSYDNKRLYKEFTRNLKKQVKNEFKELTLGDSIWIPLSLSNGGKSYGVVSNYSNYPDLPTFNLSDTINYSTDCMVFGVVESRQKDNGLFTVQVLVKDVCELDSLGGKHYALVKSGHIFEHHLISFWFFVN